jgi:hypothetical protein
MKQGMLVTSISFFTLPLDAHTTHCNISCRNLVLFGMKGTGVRSHNDMLCWVHHLRV